MRLKHFIGKNIRGYMNLNVTFRENITFLIGINGSGKTTLLKLLSGLLSPSYIDLAEIEFTEIHLECERLSDSKTFTISAFKKENRMFLEYNDISLNKKISNEILIINPYLDKRYYNRRESVDFERLNRLIIEFEELEIVNQIKNIKPPLFLGLNRRITEKSRIYIEREAYYSRRKWQNVDLLFDSVDEALSDIQDMVYENIRQNAKKQSIYSDDFRKKVIKDSFKIYQETPIVSTNYKDELAKLPSRKEKLTMAISELDIKDISEQLDTLFEQLSTILRTLSETAATDEGKVSNEYYEALLKWMINSAQLEKIDSITSYWNQYAENITKLKEPIIRFTEGVNLFFMEGHKEILIDGQGTIKIKIIEDGRIKINSIYELSSGEKQLVIIMAHLAFCRINKRGSVFIIDEPELSLHISWQEIFVDALLRASPDTQFILATHAPAILAKPERKYLCEDLSI